MVFRYSRLFALSLMPILMVSCNKEKDSPAEIPLPEAPRLTVMINEVENPESLVLEVGDTLYVSAEVSAPAGIESFTAKRLQGVVETKIDTYSADTLTVTYAMPDYELYIDHTMAGASYTFEFAVTDTMAVSATHSFNLSISESPIISFTSVEVSAYNHLSLGNLFNTLDTAQYFPLNVKTNTTKQRQVDMIFAYDRLAKWIVMSPDDVDADTIWNENVDFNWPFTVINATRLLVVDTATVDYESINTGAQLAQLLDGGSKSTILSELYMGQLIAFQLDAARGNRAGLMYISSVTGTNKADKQLSIDLKLEN